MSSLEDHNLWCYYKMVDLAPIVGCEKCSMFASKLLHQNLEVAQQIGLHLNP
jgi:hypothetical protein